MPRQVSFRFFVDFSQRCYFEVINEHRPTTKHVQSCEGSAIEQAHNGKKIDTSLLILLAFITRNSCLEFLLEGLFAQVHIDLS